MLHIHSPLAHHSLTTNSPLTPRWLNVDTPVDSEGRRLAGVVIVKCAEAVKLMTDRRLKPFNVAQIQLVRREAVIYHPDCYQGVSVEHAIMQRNNECADYIISQLLYWRRDNEMLETRARIDRTLKEIFPNSLDLDNAKKGLDEYVCYQTWLDVCGQMLGEGKLMAQTKWNDTNLIDTKKECVLWTQFIRRICACDNDMKDMLKSVFEDNGYRILMPRHQFFPNFIKSLPTSFEKNVVKDEIMFIIWIELISLPDSQLISPEDLWRWVACTLNYWYFSLVVFLPYLAVIQISL